jgi:hypothetical protein
VHRADGRWPNQPVDCAETQKRAALEETSVLLIAAARRAVNCEPRVRDGVVSHGSSPIPCPAAFLDNRWSRNCGLAGAATLAEGNALLAAFIADYNARFANAPANSKDLHRRLRAGDDLEDALVWKEERTLSQALTLQYDKVVFILEPSEQAKAAIGKRVTVVDYPDGRLAIRYRGVELAYRTFDKIRQVSQAAIVENKQLVVRTQRMVP